jgi:hypothetical protein
MKKLLLLLTGLAVLTFVDAKGPITITKATKAPKIDGIVDANDPWGTTWMNIDVPKDGNANTTSDITGKFQLTWNNLGLYVVVNVKGDKSMDTANATQHFNDCVEVFVKMDTTSGESGSYIPGDFQFRMRRGSLFPDRFDAPQLISNWKANCNFKIAQVDEGDQYTQEWQIPWALLADSSGMDPVWDSKQFKFDIQIADANSDGNRTQQMYWNSGSDEQWHNTKYLGLVTLKYLLYVKKSGEEDFNYKLNKVNSNCNDIVDKPNVNEIELFPNPVSSDLTVNVTEQLLNSKLNILNLEGQIVTTGILKSSSNKISLKPLKQGIYFVKITGATTSVVKKIIKY